MVEKLKEAFQKHQKAILLGGALAGAAALGYYGFRRLNKGAIYANVLRDKDFKAQNLPLYHHEAEFRDRLLSNVKYDLVLNFANQEGENPMFMGRARIAFRLNSKINENDRLFLDFHGNEIHQFSVNGTEIPLSQVDFSKHRIYLGQHLTVAADNIVTIKFENSYVNNSAGLHRFVDPKDNQVYIYSHLEPYNCHRWFPCFDQPSIRAPLKLQVITPQEEWKVIGNSPKLYQKVAQVQDFHDLGIPEQHQTSVYLHSFKDSPPISTYIYGVFAGNFKLFENRAPSSHSPPLQVYASQSKAGYLDAQEKMRVTQIGINYYEKFFGMKFPFEKYDQIYVPQFRIGGMENVGCVAYNDLFLKPEAEMTDSLRFRIAYITLHELAHMWFGDLVTMKWWNDLWLKESFADFMALMCLIECKEELCMGEEKRHLYGNPEIMKAKFIDNALNLDVKRALTHPIQVEVKHTIDAVNVFDEICYEKGACFIQTLRNYIGGEALKEGVSEYFHKYQYQNTITTQFIDSIQHKISEYPNLAGKNLLEWTSSWINKAGANHLETEVRENCLYLRQYYPRHGDQVYREQTIDVGIYSAEGELVQIFENVQVIPSGEPIFLGEVSSLDYAVLPNINIKGYGRIILNDNSRKIFLNNVSKIQDPCNRIYIWRTLVDHVQLGMIKPENFLECVVANLPGENTEFAIQLILEKTFKILSSYFTLDQYKTMSDAMFDVLLSKLLITDDPSRQRMLANYMLRTATTGKLDLLISWLSAEHICDPGTQRKAMPLNKALRYQILKVLFRSSGVFTQEEKERHQKLEMAEDFSDFDITMKFACEASDSDRKSKETLWKAYITPNSPHFKSLQHFKASAPNFYNFEDPDSCEHFGTLFFNDLEKVFATQHRDYAEAFFMNLSPASFKTDTKPYIEILNRVKSSDNTHFINLLEEEIERIEEIQLVRGVKN